MLHISASPAPSINPESQNVCAKAFDFSRPNAPDKVLEEHHYTQADPNLSGHDVLSFQGCLAKRCKDVRTTASTLL
jgi:hypothetical protein